MQQNQHRIKMDTNSAYSDAGMSSSASIENLAMDLEDIELVDESKPKPDTLKPAISRPMVRRRSTITRRRRGSYRAVSSDEPEDNIPFIKISRPERAEAETVALETVINGTEPEVDEFKSEVDETETEINKTQPEIPEFKPEMHKPEPEAFNYNTYTDRPRSPTSLTVPPTDVSMGMFHVKPDPIDAARNILLQPEMLLLRQDLERKRDEERKPRSRLNSTSSVFSEEELALVRRFPWLAERLKLAWAEVNEQATKTEEASKKPAAAKTAKSRAGYQQPILKQRDKTEKPKLTMDAKDNERAKPKVVFSRNVPLFVYSNKTRKAIKVGGDTSERMTEEVYKALEYNPELKKITLDLQDLCKPDRDKTIRLAVSYISSTTNFNPLVISEHMARYSGKKEAAIKYLVREIEKRLSAQREVRIERDEQWRKQFEEIFKARMEAEEKENDIMVARRQLEESRQQNQDIMTEFERQGERRRRIQLRTKSIPVADRIKPPQKKRTRRQGVHHISLHHHNTLLGPPASKSVTSKM